MNKLIRFYNKNRHIVWIVILVVVAIITLIQILNRFVYEKDNENNSTNEIKSTTFNNNYSVITGQEVTQDIKDVVDEFINLCNSQKINEAYALLSSESKEVLYPTIDDFTKNYYNKIFNTKKTYICQSWITEDNAYTYRVDFTKDMLATGSPSKTSIVDYYTVVKENDEYKLNINKFIGVEDINATTTSNNITINVNRKKVYIDYEIYDIEVVNKTQKTILLDDMQDADNIYIKDSNDKQYFWYSHEFFESDVEVRRGLTQKISIEFGKEYNPKNKVKKIVFSNIIQDNKSISISVDI